MILHWPFKEFRLKRVIRSAIKNGDIVIDRSFGNNANRKSESMKSDVNLLSAGNHVKITLLLLLLLLSIKE